MSGGTQVAEVLDTQGVRFVFTLCGGHISPILVACEQRGIRIVDVRHEVNAVFAADAVARLTGVPGVAAVTAGPGVTNSLTALKNAQMAQSPVVLLGGAAPTLLKGRGALQDIDQMSLVRPLTKWSRSVKRLRDLAPAVEQAFNEALTGVPGPVFVECPVDLLYDETTVRSWYVEGLGKGRSLASRAMRYYVNRHLNRQFAGPAPEPPKRADPAPAAPTTAALEKAARRLDQAKRPLLLVGSQALAQPESVTALADAIGNLGVPVYLSGMARGLLGRDHPLHLRHKRRNALREADLVILAGVVSDFRLDYGRQIGRRAYLIAANRSRREMNKNRRPNLAVESDAGRFLRDLAATAVTPEGRWDAWAASLRQRDDERNLEIGEQADAPLTPVNPLKLCRAIDAAMPQNGVVVADGGDFVGTASYIVKPPTPLSWLDPGPFGTLGVGAGFALGAQLCRPESEVWLLYGDGAAGFSLAEFDTFVRHKVPVIAVVGNDGAWSQIAREQVEILDSDVATRLHQADYHAVIQGFGGEGLLIDDEGEAERVLQRARQIAAAGKPVLVNALIGQTEFRKGSISM